MQLTYSVLQYDYNGWQSFTFICIKGFHLTVFCNACNVKGDSLSSTFMLIDKEYNREYFINGTSAHKMPFIATEMLNTALHIYDHSCFLSN